jgi:hypothetical protein
MKTIKLADLERMAGGKPSAKPSSSSSNTIAWVVGIIICLSLLGSCNQQSATQQQPSPPASYSGASH